MNRMLELVPVVANIHNILHGWHNHLLKGYSKSPILLAVESVQALESGLHCIASKTLFCPSHGYTFCINLWKGTSLP